MGLKFFKLVLSYSCRHSKPFYLSPVKEKPSVTVLAVRDIGLSNEREIYIAGQVITTKDLIPQLFQPERGLIARMDRTANVAMS